MPIDSTYELFSNLVKDVAWTPSGVFGLDRNQGPGYTSSSDLHVSPDSDEKWFMMGISTWGADSEGNADIVGE